MGGRTSQHRPGEPVHLAPLRRGADRGGRARLDGRARALEGQRLHRTCVDLHAFETGSELRAGLTRWIGYYNGQRPHSALAGRTPDEAYGIMDTTRLAA